MDMMKIRQQSLENKKHLTETFTNNSNVPSKDERFWTLDFNKDTKVGKAIIRPIGPAEGESDQFVTEYNHFIRRNGKILSIKCPTTGHSNVKCPICSYYFSKDKDNRDRQFARTTKYIMNILVVNDFQHPENNGKVFLYKCPVTIMDKIKEALKATDEMDMPKESVNVFDMWEGANINLITKDKGGWINYESSTISKPSPIFEDTENMSIYEDLYKKLYSLKEFTEAPTEEEVREKFENFMSSSEASKVIVSEMKEAQEEVFNEPEVEDDITEETKNEEKVVTSDDFWNSL